MCSRPFSFDDLDLAAVRGHELHDYGQADASSLDMPRRGLASIEGFEDMLAFFARYTRAAVGNFEYQVTVVGTHADMDGAAARGVLDGVGKQGSP